MSVSFMMPGTNPAKQLAYTGGGSSSGLLFTAGGTCSAIGLVSLLLAARKRPRTRLHSHRRR
jgi:LPXTG-motif cell wall-anchored protein